jgi:hypothetical protein
VHCLTHGDAVNHGMHGVGERDHHGDHGTSPGTHAPGCCALYAMSALPLASGPLVEGALLPPALSPPAEASLSGRVPERLDRPPIPSLSV